MAITLTDGNAFAIIGAGRRELEKLGRADEVAAFTAEMTSGDYNHLLQTMLKWFPEVQVEDEVCELCTERVSMGCECSRCLDCGTLYTIQQAQTALNDDLCRRCEWFPDAEVVD